MTLLVMITTLSPRSRRGGTSIRKTLRLQYRSSRNLFFFTELTQVAVCCGPYLTAFRKKCLSVEQDDL
jgi:hypothetical protein